MNRLVMSTLIAIAAASQAAYAHNGPRIYLSLANGNLLTNLDDFQNFHNITPNTRVFHGDFGQDAENPLPNFTEFPGVSGAVDGTGALLAGTTISFNILDAAKYWNGTGSVLFGPSPETISISSGLDLVTSSSGFVPGFTLVASVPSTDGWHTHPGYSLNSDAAGQFQDGVYLLELSMTNNGLTTQPFWIVFGQNMDDSVVDGAVDALSAGLVPEPASLGLLGIGTLLLMRKKR
jgi:hypothetical protein